MNEDDNDKQSTVNSSGGQMEERQQKKQEKKEEGDGKIASAAKGAVKSFIRQHIVGVCIAILAIIGILIIVGILQVLLSMPGLVMGKLKEYGQNFLSAIVGFFTGNPNSVTITQDDVTEVAQYIQDMGYDVYGYGFGKVEYEEDATNPKDTGIENSTISKVRGINGRNYILEYLIQNEAIYTFSVWSLRGYFETFGGLTGDVQSKSVGMINIMEEEYNNLFAEFTNLDALRKAWNALNETYKIDPVNKTLRIKVNGKLFGGDEYYYFDMSDWTSRYGKPLELFLAIHLSTMMPDLAYDVATKDEFNTKVNILVQKTKLTYKVFYKGIEVTDSNIDSIAYDIAKGDEEKVEEVKQDLEDLIEDGQKEQEMRWPRIESVTNHWFYETINFDYEDAKVVKSIKPSIPDNTNSLYDVQDDIVLEAKMQASRQIGEPDVKGPNKAIYKLFKEGEYYRYDGTRKTAEKIEDAKTTGKNTGVYKEPVSFIDEENRDAYKNVYSAFAILENADTEEADECYRCLKQLLTKLATLNEDELKEPESTVLSWPIPDNVDEDNIEKDPNKSGMDVTDSKDKDIIAPADGIITSVDGDTITMKFTKISKEDLEKLRI